MNYNIAKNYIWPLQGFSAAKPYLRASIQNSAFSIYCYKKHIQCIVNQSTRRILILSFAKSDNIIIRRYF